MKNTPNANVATLPTEPKPQTSKEVIAANVKLLIEQLEAGHSEGLTAYLTAMGKFHNYSFGNILEIARQMPAASRVAGMYAWNQLGRRVKKGQKGTLGLKRPITVSRRHEPDANGKLYNLACGQGRVEAFQALGEETIPAIVIDAPEQDLLLMSLVENIARRSSSSTAIFHEVRALRQRGHSIDDIAAKLGMDRTYIHGVAHLIDRGEDFLVRSVEAGRIPLSVATEIAAGHDEDVSRALSEAYEKGELRGRHLTAARRIITQCIAKRRREGKAQRDHKHLTGDALVREYKEKIQEQRTLVAKAERTRERLILLTSALRTLLADENFTNPLNAEGLQKMPAEVAARIA